MPSPAFTRIVRDAPFFDEGYGFDVFGLRLRSLARAVEAARPLYEAYFRVDSSGIEAVPAHGPAILVANHGGMLPVDAAMLCVDVLRRSTPPRIPRAVTDHFVPLVPFVGAAFARLGVVSGTCANVRHLLERGELVAILPEGTTGPAKRFRDRYRIQRWRVGFAELAIRYRVPVIPVAIVGAEESWPLLGKLRTHLFRSPYFPIPAVPFPLPVRYHIRYGTPMVLGGDQRDASDPAHVRSAALDVRLALEQLLERARGERRGVFR